jgi:hypothetical protein
MIFISYAAVGLELFLAWKFYGWPMVGISLLFYVSILFFWVNWMVLKAKHKFENGESVEEIQKKI